MTTARKCITIAPHSITEYPHREELGRRKKTKQMINKIWNMAADLIVLTISLFLIAVMAFPVIYYVIKF